MQRVAQRESVMDDEKLNSARKRLQENYQEAQNGMLSILESVIITFYLSVSTDQLLFVGVFLLYEAKKQRTIQVMDIHDIPKPKNAFFAKNKGNFQGRHHRWFA